MKKDLKSLAKWSKYLGIFGLLAGAILALAGYGLFYVGAIPGLLIFIIHIRLLFASKSAKRLNFNLRLKQNEEDMYDNMISSYVSYFRMVSLTFTLLVLTFIGIVVFIFLYPMDYYTLISEQIKQVYPFI